MTDRLSEITPVVGALIDAAYRAGMKNIFGDETTAKAREALLAAIRVLLLEPTELLASRDEARRLVTMGNLKRAAVEAELSALRSAPPSGIPKEDMRQAMIEEVAAYLFDKYAVTGTLNYADMPEGSEKTDWWLHAVALVQTMEGRLRVDASPPSETPASMGYSASAVTNEIRCLRHFVDTYTARDEYDATEASALAMVAALSGSPAVQPTLEVLEALERLKRFEPCQYSPGYECDQIPRADDGCCRPCRRRRDVELVRGALGQKGEPR